MFWGTILKQKSSYKLGETEDLISPLLHISNAAIGSDCTPDDQITVFAKIKDTEFILAYLQKGKNRICIF